MSLPQSGSDYCPRCYADVPQECRCKRSKERPDLEEWGPWVWMLERQEWVAEASGLRSWNPGPASTPCPACQRPVDTRHWSVNRSVEDIEAWVATCPFTDCQARLVALND